MENFKSIAAGLFIAVAAVGLTASSAQAIPVNFNTSWTSTSPTGFSLTGMFSFDNSTAGSTVEENELLSFMIEGFQGATSLGTFSGIPDNFNFDAITSQFLLGGLFPGSNTNQEWGNALSGIRFITGAINEVLLKDNMVLSVNPVTQSTLVATAKSIPEPGTLALLGLGLAGLGFARRRKAA